MTIEYVQIRNFRSIIDTKNIYLDNNLTVLAGKNESGKSNILKALECFSKNKFEEEDLPEKFHYDSSEDELNISEVAVSLNLTSSEIKSKIIFDKLFTNKSKLDFGLDDFQLIVTRYSGNFSQSVEGSLYEYVFEEEFNVINKRLTDLITKLEIVEDDFNDNDLENCLDYWPFGSHGNLLDITNELHDVNEYLGGIYNDEAFQFEPFKMKIIDLKKEIQELEDYIDNFLEEINKFCDLFLPNFILFDSFDDILPDFIDDTNNGSAIVERFFKVVDTNPKELLKAGRSMRKKMSKKISSSITGEFENYYNQNEVTLELDLDGADLCFYVYDGDANIPFKPGQRSKGFQWFLSFFLTLKAEANSNYVLLIDEPGLYLHAKAQRDILKVLESLSNDSQIIMTTHSPYLIDSSRLERVRLVLKNENTYIENKIHKGADKDTLTPIITSIGADLSKDLVFSMNSVNILVEGISDYYYLEALKMFVNIPGTDNNNFRFIPNVGATQIQNLAVLLIGWGLEFLVILDNDSEGKRVEKTLLDKLLVDESKIIFVSNIENSSIEDMFSKEDFKKYVLCEHSNEDMQISNSKRASSGKALLAKKFNELCHSPGSNLNFSQETMNNFTELFTKLSFSMSGDKVLSFDKD